MNVFYRPEMIARTKSLSPSAHKPALVVKDWLRKQLILSDDLVDFAPATVEQLCAAHDRDYVLGVLSCELENGFNNCDRSVAASLPWTSGSMLAAARHAVEHRTTTCSPTSGFHHAGHAHGGGFCTFNGLVVAAQALKADGLVDTVGILDCDIHYGDGTQNIIDRLGLHWIRHHSMGECFRTGQRVRGSRFANWLHKAIEDCSRCDLVLYQAGADPHIHDPLGGVLSTTQMIERDDEVFYALRNRALAWNLAGGYQTLPEVAEERMRLEPILALHRLTLRAAKELL